MATSLRGGRFSIHRAVVPACGSSTGEIDAVFEGDAFPSGLSGQGEIPIKRFEVSAQRVSKTYATESWTGRIEGRNGMETT